MKDITELVQEKEVYLDLVGESHDKFTKASA